MTISFKILQLNTTTFEKANIHNILHIFADIHLEKRSQNRAKGKIAPIQPGKSKKSLLICTLEFNRFKPRLTRIPKNSQKRNNYALTPFLFAKKMYNYSHNRDAYIYLYAEVRKDEKI